ncbi:MAG: hypothetical protein K8R46_06175 [Pirellulales bacterium]|nr:hypothetical protein [Pirellulales bacterium]
MPPEKSHDGFAVDTSLAQPLPEVLGGEDILIHRTAPVPVCDQVPYKLLQNGANGVLANSP